MKFFLIKISYFILLVNLICNCGGTVNNSLKNKSAAESELLKTMRRISPLPPQKPPLWIYNDTSIDKNFIKSIFASDLQKSEKSAKDAVLKKARIEFISIISKLILYKLEKIAVSQKLPIELFNPKNPTDRFENSFSGTAKNNFQEEKYYIEKWQNNSGDVFFSAYLMLSIRKELVNNVLSSAIDYEILKLKDSYQKNQNTGFAKQINKIIEEIEDFKKSGISK